MGIPFVIKCFHWRRCGHHVFHIRISHVACLGRMHQLWINFMLFAFIQICLEQCVSISLVMSLPLSSPTKWSMITSNLSCCRVLYGLPAMESPAIPLAINDSRFAWQGNHDAPVWCFMMTCRSSCGMMILPEWSMVVHHDLTRTQSFLACS